MVERLGRLARERFGLSDRAGYERTGRHRRAREDSVFMLVPRRVPDDDTAVLAAAEKDREFGFEGNEAFKN